MYICSKVPHIYQKSNAILFQSQTPNSYPREYQSSKKNSPTHQTIRSPHPNSQNMASSTQDPTTTTTTATKQEEEKPWHAAFPAPRLEAGVMPAARAQMILSMKIASMLIIDVRRTDYEGGSVRGSLNIPAQGFWWNRGML
jgi:hypothetical protein